MKKVISILLVIALLLGMAPYAMADETAEQCEIQIHSNFKDTTMFSPCRNIDSIAYIPATFASAAGNCDYEPVSGGIRFYARGFDFVTDTYYQEEKEDGKTIFWVPIADTLEQMNVLTVAAPGHLGTTGKLYFPADVVSVADKILSSHVRISAMDGGAGNIAIASATLFNVITEWKWAEGVTGKYAQDKYRDAFVLLMQKNDEDNDNELLNAVQGTDKILSVLSGLEKLSVGAEDADDVMKCFQAAQLTDSEALLALYEDASNPLKTVTEQIGFENDDIFKGFDLESQLEIYEYLIMLTQISTYYVDMLQLALFPEIVYDVYSGYWGDSRLFYAAEEIVNYFTSDDYMDVIGSIALEEIETFAYGGVNEALDKVSGSASVAAAAFKVVTDGITGLLSGTAHSETIEDEEMTYYLAQIQATAKQLYKVYSQVPGAEINAKYAMLLYLRCSKVWSYLFEEQVPEADFEGFREVVTGLTEEIMDISDFDLAGIVENEEIYYEDIKTPEIDMTSFSDGKLSTVIEVDGFQYQYDIQFNKDGTVSVGGGMPYSEYDEHYDGAYTLLQGEEPYTLELDLVGGFVTMGDENAYEVEQREIQMTIRITPVPDTEEYIVSILQESEPVFYTHDLPNFTYIPYG